MNRLTERHKGYAYFPHCFDVCDGDPKGCDDCDFIYEICDKLARYEDLEEQGRLIELVKEIKSVDRWIPCSERLPEEHDSIFAKIKNTNKWNNAMFEKISDDVNVTVEYEDGTCITKTSHTLDGKWNIEQELKLYNPKVIAWMPLPEPYKEGDINE